MLQLCHHWSPLVKTVYLIEGHPARTETEGGGSEQKTSISQLASVESVFMWAVDQTDNVVQPFLTKLNHNYDAILKRFPSQCYKPRIELRGFLPATNRTQSLRKWNNQKDDKNYYSPKYWMIHSQACKGRSSVNIGRFHDERNNNINKKSWSLNSPNS